MVLSSKFVDFIKIIMNFTLRTMKFRHNGTNKRISYGGF